jgi:16S rRNA processing protein RimM
VAEPATPGWDDLVLVGIVARTHGNRGEVIVNPHTDFVSDRFRVGAALEARLADLSRRRVTLTSSRVHQGRPVIGLEGVTSIGEAEAYAGAELRIDPAEQGPLPSGSYYHHELIGCAVVSEAGEDLGLVIGVEGEMNRSRLVVAGRGRRFEMPLVDAYCQVDIAGRRIVVNPPEGLLDL